MANVINSLASETYGVKQQLGDLPNVTTSLKRFSSSVKLKNLFAKQYVIVPNDSFILGNSSLAVLGTSKLGDRRSQVDSFVYPYNNIIEEDLLDDTFIDTTNSTCELDFDNEQVIFDSGEVLQSLVVAKINNPINNIKLTDIGTTSNYTIEITVDNTNWYEIQKSVLFSLPTPSNTDALRYRITANEGLTLTGPIKIQVNKG